MGQVTSESFRDPFQYACDAISDLSSKRNSNGRGNFLFQWL
jgi:hypothetical protein